MSEDQSLGAIALMRNEGNPNAALADLMTQVIGMCGFIGAMGQDKETILQAFDALLETGRKALIEILDEDKAKADGK